MKLIFLKIISLMLVLSGSNTLYARMQSLPSRALPACATCPMGVPLLCALCVNGPAIIKDLVIQHSLTLCSGVTGFGGCSCSYDGEISWNTDETHYNIKQQTGPVAPVPFQPYFNNGYYDTFKGWSIPPFSTGGSFFPFVITAEFQVPLDFDPSVTPTVTLHWFNPDVTFNMCTGTYVNWQVTADFFTNLAPINQPATLPKYIETTGDILIVYYTGPEPDGYVQQQVTVPLTGPALVPGAYAQISATRIPPTGAGHVDSSCASLLTLITFDYHKLPQ